MTKMEGIKTATENVLNNSFLLKKVLNQFCMDPLYTLHLRQVNKLFNSELLHLIRKSHQTITLQHTDTHFKTATSDNQINWISVNNTTFQPFLAPKYFKFLRDVVGVKVTRFIGMKLDWICYEELRDKLHTDVMEVLLKDQNLKVFVGMEDLCPEGCLECTRHALESREYGPVQWNVFKNSFNDLKKHYSKLIVDERFLNKIAFESINTSNPKDLLHFLQAIKSLIPSNISCDHLVFIIGEFYEDEEEDAHDPKTPMPLEVIQELCRIWRVKSIGIRFEYSMDIKKTSKSLKNGCFTRFRFEEPFHLTQRSNLRFDHVDLCIQDALTCCTVINSSNDTYFNYNNIIANARKVFPTGKMMLHGCTRWRRCCSGDGFNERVLADVLRTVWKDNMERNLEVTVRLFPTVVASPGNDFEIPETLEYLHRTLTCSVLPTTCQWTEKDIIFFVAANAYYPDYKEHVGKVFRITDKQGNCVINLELFVKKDQLKEAYNTGYLKHFVSL